MELLFLLPLLVSAVHADTTLKFANVLYRHGDRSPIEIFPTDPHREDTWPQGPGWLTTIGMQQEYALGGWLRTRYVDSGFLSSEYKSTELKVFSSDISRCLMSAYCNLAAMFPPGPGRQFNASLNWQPIPVHTRPTTDDNTLNMGRPCPRYIQLLNESISSSPFIKQEEAENKEFYQWLSQQTSVAHENIATVWSVADTLKIEKLHNLTLAPWVNETVYNKLMSLLDITWLYRFLTKEEERLEGGPLLGEFIDNFRTSIDTNNPSTYKMHIYSAHDSTVAAQLRVMDVFNGLSPPYAAMILLELHQNSSGHYSVRLFYKNSTTDSDVLQDLAIPGCDHDCPLDRFIELTKPMIPVNWEKECALKPGHSTASSAGLSCFACSDVTQLKYCDYVKRCQPNEVCYVSKSQSADGRLRYSSGCTLNQQCTMPGSSGMNSSSCLQCCTSDFCNMAGCGDQGFPDRATRGPICYDCNHVGSAAECDTVKLCSSNEACKIEEYKWGNGDRLFKLGCEAKQICALGGRMTLKRSAPYCANCCDGDFCSTNCTASVMPGIIGIGNFPPSVWMIRQRRYSTPKVPKQMHAKNDVC